MKKRRNDTFQVILLGIVVGLVVLTGLLWGLPSLLKERTLAAILPLITVLTLAVFAIFILSRKYKEVKKGFPAQDERSRRIFIFAGYRTFLISLYWFLAISFAEDYRLVSFRDTQQAIGVGLLGMAIIFGLNYLWASKHGVDF